MNCTYLAGTTLCAGRCELHLPEDIAVETRILTLRATDADHSANDKLIYGLASHTSHHLGHVTDPPAGHVTRTWVTCSRWTTGPVRCAWWRR